MKFERLVMCAEVCVNQCWNLGTGELIDNLQRVLNKTINKNHTLGILHNDWFSLQCVCALIGATLAFTMMCLWTSANEVSFVCARWKELHDVALGSSGKIGGCVHN